ncbi:MAG: acyltransferase [Candidatus Heimdallarchaeota archaeon]
MRYVIGQWLVIGALLGMLAAIWENIVNPLKIGLAWKLWLLGLLGWLISNFMLLAVYWLCLTLMTEKEGKITGYNMALWAIAITCYDISISLTYKLFFHRVMPVPLLKLYGLKCGRNFSLSVRSWIVDPDLITFGDNCRVGGEAIVTGHLLEGRHVYRKRIVVGDNVEIGGKSAVAPGAYIEDNVVLGAQSLVLKNVQLKQDTTYVGVPARPLQDRKSQE